MANNEVVIYENCVSNHFVIWNTGKIKDMLYEKVNKNDNINDIDIDIAIEIG